MTKLAPEWVRTSDPLIRSPARYRWTTAPARLEEWRMYTSVVEKSPGRKIERKQYVVLIEKEVPNLVLADSDFSMPDYSDGWTWKRPVTKDKWSKSNSRRGFKQHDLFYPSSLVVSIPDQFDKSLEWPAGWESWDQWNLITDNLNPTTNYHVHLDSDSDHAAQY